MAATQVVNPTLLQALQDLDDLRAGSDQFFEQVKREVTRTYAGLSDRINAVEAALRNLQNNSQAVTAESAEIAAANAAAAARLRDPSNQGLKFEALLEEIETEYRQSQHQEDSQQGVVVMVGTPTVHNRSTGATASHNNTAGAVNADTCHFLVHGTAAIPTIRHGTVNGTRDERLDMSDTSVTATPVRRPVRAGANDAVGTPEQQHSPTRANEVSRPLKSYQAESFVLVEFKRGRVLQFESDVYVAPGEYTVVGGDRGEDIGLVTFTWPNNGASTLPPTPMKQNSQMGVGKVLRVATALEVAQLQGVQAELENRAKEVAQLKVMEHQLPMRIVDAEYQFDRKKLTFFYQSQHRLDFRVLVRDLYKTFRARIWMELE